MIKKLIVAAVVACLVFLVIGLIAGYLLVKSSNKAFIKDLNSKQVSDDYKKIIASTTERLIPTCERMGMLDTKKITPEMVTNWYNQIQQENATPAPQPIVK